MKLFRCDCGQRVFFDSTTCMSCGTELGFDPQRLVIVSLQPGDNGVVTDQTGAVFRKCRNYVEHNVCNWLVTLKAGDDYCLGCARTEIIPHLDVPGNHLLWWRLEAAKRRLLYSLLWLDLPLTLGDGGETLRFRFLEDQRRNPAVIESFVTTGHFAGTITINLAEADDVARHTERLQTLERYRTLLGHFRHESGHFYLEPLVWARGEAEAFRRLFGDEQMNYASSLEAYYRDGPPANWSDHYVSPYASAHPHEDWAETFAHYLHIVDALETAETVGLVAPPADGAPGWSREWMELSVTLNELNRSLGVEDPYPFILTDVVLEKLNFIDRLVRPRAAPAVGDRH